MVYNRSIQAIYSVKSIQTKSGRGEENPVNIKVCISIPFKIPAEDAQLVIFKNPQAEFGVVLQEYTDLFIRSCIKYAKKYQVYLVTCLFEAMDCLCLALFSPEGELLGMQKATHLNLNLTTLFATVSEVDVISTPIGKIFLAVDVDIYHPEVLRKALLDGCDYIISSQYFELVDFHQDRILFGARSASAANGLFVINVNNITSCITAPSELTQTGDGFWIYPTDQPSVSAEFNFEETAKLRRNIRQSLQNSPCLEKYLSILGK